MNETGRGGIVKPVAHRRNADHLQFILTGFVYACAFVVKGDFRNQTVVHISIRRVCQESQQNKTKHKLFHRIKMQKKICKKLSLAISNCCCRISLYKWSNFVCRIFSQLQPAMPRQSSGTIIRFIRRKVEYRNIPKIKHLNKLSTKDTQLNENTNCKVVVRWRKSPASNA